jgi:hypothetical protein
VHITAAEVGVADIAREIVTHLYYLGGGIFSSADKEIRFKKKERTQIVTHRLLHAGEKRVLEVSAVCV